MTNADDVTLGSDVFPVFYRAVHGHDPFPWQSELVERVLEDGRWPDLIDVPTGLGKTSMLDVAVFVAAATKDRPGPGRPGRRRCFFVVDRRIVVDEAYGHAEKIAKTIRSEEGRPGVVGRVAAALRSFAPDAGGDLLPVTRMRGGTTWAAAWLDRPDRPGIVLGTVDQIGSRLLFRGNGVSDLRRPLDAALVGTDSLVLVDEAHLSVALLRTVTSLQQRDRLGLPVPGLDVVRLTATAGEALNRHPYVLDIDAHRDNVVAWQRLSAAKRLTVEETSTKDCAKVLAETALDRMRAFAESTPSSQYAPVALVVCNTVDRARAVHNRVGRLLAADAGIDADHELLIGRTRPLDRPDLQSSILARFGVGRRPEARAAVLVATQTVEVGVNLDADVLVTESASWDALVQRLGRLNRLGTLRDRFSGQPAAAAVVVHDGQVDGPVYGIARDETWRVLHAKAVEAVAQGYDGLDVSPLACRKLTDDPESLAGTRFVRTPVGVPVLLTPTLDAWVQTSPIPLVDPPIEPFLHGFGGGVAAVQVLWRDRLLGDDPIDDPFGDRDVALPAAEIQARLTQWPPRSSEIVEVPFVAVRQWMRGEEPQPVDDLESGPETESRVRRVGEPFDVLVRRSSAGAPMGEELETTIVWRWIGADALRPGDLVVVPVERGGLDAYGWVPGDRRRVVDVAEVATFSPTRSRRGAALRLDRALPVRLGMTGSDVGAVGALLDKLYGDPSDDALPTVSQISDFGRDLLRFLPSSAPPGSGWTVETWRLLLRWLLDGARQLIEIFDPADAQITGVKGPVVWERILVGPLPAAVADATLAEGDDEEAGTSSGSRRPVPISAHLAAVRRRASDIAAALDLPGELRTVVADAAEWHDLGKHEERFQAMLHSGDTYAAAHAVEPLAKSGMDPADSATFRHARRRSRLPAGVRHEAWSAALVEEYARTAGYPGDVDLLIHLVASHHGYARPWARLVADPAPRDIEVVVNGGKVTVSSARTVSLEHPARFARLNDRYGRWGLALLESIVRCADVTVSEEGS